jgi:hypothetical protein
MSRCPAASFSAVARRLVGRGVADAVVSVFDLEAGFFLRLTAAAIGSMGGTRLKWISACPERGQASEAECSDFSCSESNRTGGSAGVDLVRGENGAAGDACC